MMTQSRLATLKKAKDHLAHGLKHNFKDLEARGLAMIDLLLEITSGKPLAPTNKQYLPEMYFAQMYARDLIKDLPLLLLRQGRFEDVYGITNDPSALGGCISWGLSTHEESPVYEELIELFRKSLKLGGVLSSNFSTKLESLRDSLARMEGRNQSPLDLAKMLVTNQIKNEWAIEPEAQNYHRYGQYMAFFIAYICDRDPQWGLRFLHENQDHLSEIIDTNYIGLQAPHLKSIAGCFPSLLTANLLVELNRTVPEYYEDLMSSRFIEGLLVNAVLGSPDFKIADLPVHENLSKPFLTAIFSQCAGQNCLTPERLADLRQAWDRVAPKGRLVSDSMKGDSFKYMATAMDEYNALIRTPGLNAEKIIENNREFPYVGSQWLHLDALRNKPGARIDDDPQVYANHLAFILASTTVDLEFIQKLPMNSVIIGVIALESQRLGADDSSDEALLELLKNGFENKENHGEVAKLSKKELDSAMELMPDFDMTKLRKINWVDRSIKAGMLEEDLGM